MAASVSAPLHPPHRFLATGMLSATLGEAPSALTEKQSCPKDKTHHPAAGEECWLHFSSAALTPSDAELPWQSCLRPLQGSKVPILVLFSMRLKQEGEVEFWQHALFRMRREAHGFVFPGYLFASLKLFSRSRHSLPPWKLLTACLPGCEACVLPPVLLVWLKGQHPAVSGEPPARASEMCC